MVNDYERQEFWKNKTKIKVVKCGNTKSWYWDRVGKVFEVDSTSARDYYVVEEGRTRCVLMVDAEIVN